MSKSQRPAALDNLQGLEDPAVVAGWFEGCLGRIDSLPLVDAKMAPAPFAPFVATSRGPREADLIRAFIDDLDAPVKGAWTYALGRGLLAHAEQARGIWSLTIGFELIADVAANTALETAVDLFSLAGMRRLRSEIEPLALAALATCSPQDRDVFCRLRSAIRTGDFWSDQLLLQEARIQALSQPWNAHTIFSDIPKLEETLRDDQGRATFFAQLLHAGLSLEALVLLALRTPEWFSRHAGRIWFQFVQNSVDAPIKLGGEREGEFILYDVHREEKVAVANLGMNDPAIANLPYVDQGIKVQQIEQIFHERYFSLFSPESGAYSAESVEDTIIEPLQM